MTDPDLIRQAAALLQGAHKVAVLTGAGVSKESGVPTFRDAMDGLWARYDPEELATRDAFRRNPKLVWDWYEYRRQMVRAAQPNPGHYALAQLEARCPAFALITQNVDNLHERAGSQQVIHLHGNIAQSKCFAACQGEPTRIDLSQLDYDRDTGPPPCPHCGAPVRPDVVWFGEILPQEPLHRAFTHSQQADVMLVVGTSGLVTPAATLPVAARDSGAQVIEINPDQTAISQVAHLRLQGASGVVLPRLMEALGADT
jgi:NAD-dependent deacetylase